MNVFDRVVATVNPIAGLKRQQARMAMNVVQTFTNSGYSHSAASHRKKAVAGWDATSKTPQEDIDYNLDTLRQRSRDQFMSAPIARSAIMTNRTNVIGAGLRLKSQVDYGVLGITQEQARAYELQFQREFELWASSKFCDTTRLNDHYGQQGIALISCLMNGDAIAIPQYRKPTSYMPYSLNILMVEADRLSTPGALSQSGSAVIKKHKNGNWIYSGVEIDKTGAVVAYHICNTHPGTSITGVKKQWTRVAAFGPKTGNPNIIHLMESERCEQYRGVPFLAPVIEDLKQMSRYTEAELMAAVITAFFTAFIKTTGNTAEQPVGESINEELPPPTDELDQPQLAMGSGTINVLGVDEDIVFADPKRPASGFESFMRAITEQIGAALEIPREVLVKSFSNSYSASRAAFLEAWKVFKKRRAWFASRFCQPIYELFLAEAVAIGRVQAPGFFADPLIRRAYCGAEWNGPSSGQIDPTKEVEASIMKCEYGFSTYSKETMELTGQDFESNAAQLRREKELLGITQPQKGGAEPNGSKNNGDPGAGEGDPTQNNGDGGDANGGDGDGG